MRLRGSPGVPVPKPSSLSQQFLPGLAERRWRAGDLSFSLPPPTLLPLFFLCLLAQRARRQKLPMKPETQKARLKSCPSRANILVRDTNDKPECQGLGSSAGDRLQFNPQTRKERFPQSSPQTSARAPRPAGTRAHSAVRTGRRLEASEVQSRLGYAVNRNPPTQEPERDEALREENSKSHRTQSTLGSTDAET